MTPAEPAEPTVPEPVKIEVDTSEIENAKLKLDELLGGDIIDRAKEFGEMWNLADGAGKTAVAMSALSDVTSTVADGLSQAAKNSSDWAAAAKAAEIASKSFAAAEATIAAVEAIKSAAELPFPANVIGIATASA